MSGSNSRNTTLIIALLAVTIIVFAFVIISKNVSTSIYSDIGQLDDYGEEER